MQARDIEVGEVGAVGFMEVEVDFVGLGAGGEDHGLEEGGGGEVGFLGEEAPFGEGEVG